MNNKGKQYIQDIQSKYKSLELQQKSVVDRLVDDSSIYERLMRLWQESRYYELNTDEEHRQIAISTLREDYINSLQS